MKCQNHQGWDFSCAFGENCRKIVNLAATGGTGKQGFEIIKKVALQCLVIKPVVLDHMFCKMKAVVSRISRKAEEPYLKDNRVNNLICTL